MYWFQYWKDKNVNRIGFDSIEQAYEDVRKKRELGYCVGLIRETIGPNVNIFPKTIKRNGGGKRWHTQLLKLA